jgi:hypothetical protein
MSAFLTAGEVIELTGYKAAKKQIEWLTRNGVKHWVPATGRPVVPRSAIDGAPAADKESLPFEPAYVA